MKSVVYLAILVIFSSFAHARNRVEHGPIKVSVVRIKNGGESPFANVNIKAEIMGVHTITCEPDGDDDPGTPTKPFPCDVQYVVSKYVGRTDTRGVLTLPAFSEKTVRKVTLVIGADFLDQRDEIFCDMGYGISEPYPQPDPSAPKSIHPDKSHYFWVEGKSAIEAFPPEIKFECRQSR